MFGNFGGRAAKRLKNAGDQQRVGHSSRQPVGRSRRPVFELLEQRAMLTTIYSPLPSTADGATGSLRADIALADADTGSQPDIIQLSAGTYNLTSGSGATGDQQYHAHADHRRSGDGADDHRSAFRGSGL